MKNILVLTDFSNPAYEALYYIGNLLKNRESRITILNAYTEHTPLKSPSVGTSKKSLFQQLEDEANEGLRETRHRIRLDQNNPRHSIHSIALNQNLPEAVLELLGKEQIDLIVMGNKGRTAKQTVFWGSNVLKVVNAVEDCAIITVPEGVGAFRLNEIAFMADYHHNYTAKLLEPLTEIARLSSAAIRVIHLNEESPLKPEDMENLNKLNEILGDIAHTLHWMTDFRKKSDAIHSYVSERGMGMLAMLHYKHGFLDSLTRENVISKLNFMVEVPFLILPDRE